MSVECEFGVETLPFLGHTIPADRMLRIGEKVAEIRNFPVPHSLNQLRRFLGMINFYQRFLPNSACTLLPLTELMKPSKSPFSMPPGVKAAFAQIKDQLANLSKLAYQQPDATLSLLIDASQAADGAVIQQRWGEQ